MSEQTLSLLYTGTAGLFVPIGPNVPVEQKLVELELAVTAVGDERHGVLTELLGQIVSLSSRIRNKVDLRT